jgi:hypothetical protein
LRAWRTLLGLCIGARYAISNPDTQLLDGEKKKYFATGPLQVSFFGALMTPVLNRFVIVPDSDLNVFSE